MKGAELELQAAPSDNLRLYVGLAYLDTEYTKFPNAQLSTPNPQSPFGQHRRDRTGRRQRTGARTGLQRFARDQLRHPDLERHVGHQRFVRIHGLVLLGARQPSRSRRRYGLVNAQLGWRNPSEAVRVYLFGRNLADEEYTQFVSDGGLGDSVPPGRAAHLRDRCRLLVRRIALWQGWTRTPAEYITEADEGLHPTQDHPLWQESVLLHWYDRRQGIGGWHRIGHEANNQRWPGSDLELRIRSSRVAVPALPRGAADVRRPDRERSARRRHASISTTSTAPRAGRSPTARCASSSPAAICFRSSIPSRTVTRSQPSGFPITSKSPAALPDR